MGGKLFQELVFGEHAKAETEFDIKHKLAVDRVVADIERIFNTLVMVTVHDTKLFLGPRYDSFSLLNEALSFLVSSLHLVRQGMRVESLALLRVAVEAASVAIHVVLEAKAHARYVENAGKHYSSPRAVSFAKHHIHRISEFWGALSQAAIHPNRRAFGPRMEDEGVSVVRVGRQRADPKQEEVTLALVSTASLMVLRAAEIVLFKPDAQKPMLVVLEGTSMKMLALADGLLRERFLTLDQLSFRAAS